MKTNNFSLLVFHFSLIYLFHPAAAFRFGGIIKAMVYIDIPFVIENNRIDRALARKEIQVLDISDDVKNDAFEAIYHRNPLGVNFANKDLKQAQSLQTVLSKLGAPYRQVEIED